MFQKPLPPRTEKLFSWREIWKIMHLVEAKQLDPLEAVGILNQTQGWDYLRAWGAIYQTVTEGYSPHRNY